MALADKLMRAGSVRRFDRDEIIVSEGEQGSEMFIVLSGEVDIYKDSPDHSFIKITTLKPGSFFGEMSLLEDLPRSASAVAATEAVLLAIDKGNLPGFIKEQPDIAYKILKGLSSRIRSLNEELAGLRRDGAEFTKKADALDGADPGTGAPQAASGGVQAAGGGVQAAGGGIKAAGGGIKAAGGGIWLPPGHRQYDVVEPEAYRQFVYEKEILCPLCDGHFTTEVQKVTKLRLDRVESDFRKVYTEFDPLWYSIIVCPFCSYANFQTEYSSITDKQWRLAKEKAAGLGPGHSFKYSRPRNINQVFAAHYLALAFTEAIGCDASRLARLWMELNWLYKDAGDDEMQVVAADNAFRYYHDVLYNSKSNISTEQEQTIFILLGEMLHRKGDKDEALKMFYKAVNKKVGKPILNKMAEDRLYQLKHG